MRSGPQVALARNVSVESCVSSDYLSLSLICVFLRAYPIYQTLTSMLMTSIGPTAGRCSAIRIPVPGSRPVGVNDTLDIMAENILKYNGTIIHSHGDRMLRIV